MAGCVDAGDDRTVPAPPALAPRLDEVARSSSTTWCDRRGRRCRSSRRFIRDGVGIGDAAPRSAGAEGRFRPDRRRPGHVSGPELRWRRPGGSPRLPLRWEDLVAVRWKAAAPGPTTLDAGVASERGRAADAVRGYRAVSGAAQTMPLDRGSPSGRRHQNQTTRIVPADRGPADGPRRTRRCVLFCAAPILAARGDRRSRLRPAHFDQPGGAHRPGTCVLRMAPVFMNRWNRSRPNLNSLLAFTFLRPTCAITGIPRYP